MRIVYLGFQTWGWESLRALIDHGHDIPLVLTHPASDHPYERIWNRSVAELARDAGIAVIERHRLDDPALLAQITDLNADLLFASDWRTILSPAALATTRLGGINVHDALLPRYGGFAPINWAIARGEASVGITAHMMSDEVDLGDIVAQVTIPVGPDDTATDAVTQVFARLGPLSVHAVKCLETPGFAPEPQDRTIATFFPKRRPEDIAIDVSQSAQEVCNLIRAQSAPYPAAFIRHRDTIIAVRKARLAEPIGDIAGTIHRCPEHGTRITCGSPKTGFGAIQIITIELPNGQEQPVGDYFKAHSKVLC